MIIVPFEPVHLENINPTKIVTPEWEGEAVTVIEGVPLAVFGLGVQGRVGTMWAIIGDTLKSKPVTLHRLALRNLPIIAAHFGVYAIETEGDSPKSRKWLKRLGFEEAGPRMRLRFG